jgi:hypothetical protein
MPEVSAARPKQKLEADRPGPVCPVQLLPALSLSVIRGYQLARPHEAKCAADVRRLSIARLAAGSGKAVLLVTGGKALPDDIHDIVGGTEFATAGGAGGFVKLWDTHTLQQLGSAFPGSPGMWANAIFTPDGSKLVTVYQDGRGAVWPASIRAWEVHACRVAGRNLTHGRMVSVRRHRSYETACR